MNTTFTTYAEKKAKQFLNLLQGYTKGIRITAILILLLMGVSNAWGAHKGSNSGFWDNEGLKITFNVNGISSEKKLNYNSPETTSLGEVTTILQITNTVVNFWTNWGYSANSSTVYWELYKSSTKIGSTYERGKTGDEGYNGSNSTNTVTDITDILALTTGAGDYTIRVHAKFVSTEGTYWYNRNVDNGYYSFTFTIPQPTENEFKVTAVANPTAGGTVTPTSATAMGQNTGGDITAKANTGYTFTNWTIKTGTGYFGTSGTSTTSTTANTKFRPTADASIQANFTANEYTVTLDNQNATTAGTATVTATYGSAMPVITIPKKTGYTFGGYYTNTNGGGTKYYNVDGTSAKNWDKTSKTTLYAKWTETKYDIQININGNGTTNQTGTKSIGIMGISATATPAAGYIFKNWTVTGGAHVSDANSATTTITATATGTVTANFEATPTTIYLKPSANWKQANARFAVYAFGGGSGDKWVDMTPVGCNDEYYMVDVPAGYTQFKFVRLNPNADDYGWGDDVAWGQTDNLSIQNNGDNLWDMTKKMHLNIGSWSADSNGRFAAYFFEQGKDGKWVSMFKGNDSNVYYCDIPNGTYTHLILCRMDPNNSTNDWNNYSVWHQTGDILLGVDNYYTITSWGTDGKDCSAVGSYIMVGEWTKLDLPKITYTQPANGSVTVKTSRGEAITTGSSVEFDTEIIVTVTPNAGYAVNTATITIGGKQQTLYSGENTITVCGNTSINVSFKQKAEWYIIGIDGNWDLQEKYKFIDGRVYVDLGEKADKTFKIAKASGNNIDNNNQYGGITFQGHDNSHTLNSANGYGGEATVKMVHNGGYVFVWDEDTKKLTIEYPNVCFLHGKFNEWKDNEAHALHNQVAMVKLERNQEYEFKVADKGVYRTSNAYGTPIQASGTITMDDETAYNGDSRGWHNCKIKATVTGIYRFSYNRETHVLTITYPEGSEPKVDDYRLAYKNSASGSFHPAHFIRKNTTASEKLDTVSFFVDDATSTPQIILQRCTAVANGVGTWENFSGWQDVAVEAAGVYNFVLKQTNSGNTHNAEIDMSKKHAYTGHYYIRTNCAAGGWDMYAIPDNLMTYASYPDRYENFDHYYCKWVENPTENVSFTIANDYSYCVSDTMTTDNIATNSCLPDQQASVRFGWDSKSNELSRAYLSGSTNISDRFLVLIGDAKLKDANGHNFNVGGLNPHETNFADLQNWIYQVDVTASKDTYVKLTANYKGKVQYFHGSQNTGAQLLTSSDESEYKMRIVYDFKTNHLVAAWLGGGNTIEGENRELGAEMMIIRKNQNKAEQLLFNPNTNTLSSVETVYAVTTFTKDFITSNRTQYERALYWVSFPFDVRIGDVFGFGEYGDHWIIQYYDGDARAKYGLFEDSGTYWKFITNTDAILHKNTGYVLTLDLDKVRTSFINNVEDVSLYFPSTTNLGIITGTLPESVTVPPHECKIVMPDFTAENKRDRRIYDSHWNMIGVPVFADVNGFLTNPAHVRDGISFYYEYLPATNSYQATNKTADFQTMYGYMVQFAGTINWSSKDVTFNPNQQLAARRNSESELPEKVVLGLELVQGEEKADQTFVQLQQEGATTDFDMNIDLTKIINSGANIYTLTNDRIQAAGNALPMEEAIVPVGVQIAAEGEYTFRMPDGTEGMVVELVDYETNTRTNLLLSDYIVTLPKGTSKNRFALHIQPQKDVVTGVESIGENGKVKTENGKPNKFLIDGKLIIRTADGIFDAQGHRL